MLYTNEEEASDKLSSISVANVLRIVAIEQVQDFGHCDLILNIVAENGLTSFAVHIL